MYKIVTRVIIRENEEEEYQIMILLTGYKNRTVLSVRRQKDSIFVERRDWRRRRRNKRVFINVGPHDDIICMSFVFLHINFYFVFVSFYMSLFLKI